MFMLSEDTRSHRARGREIKHPCLTWLCLHGSFSAFSPSSGFGYLFPMWTGWGVMERSWEAGEVAVSGSLSLLRGFAFPCAFPDQSNEQCVELCQWHWVSCTKSE